jgi:hypothetical protein
MHFPRWSASFRYILFHVFICSHSLPIFHSQLTSYIACSWASCMYGDSAFLFVSLDGHYFPVELFLQYWPTKVSLQVFGYSLIAKKILCLSSFLVLYLSFFSLLPVEGLSLGSLPVIHG